MANNLSFSQQGSFPVNPTVQNIYRSLTQGNKSSQSTSSGILPSTNFSPKPIVTPQNFKPAPITPGLITPKASGGVTKQKVTSPDGTVTEHTFSNTDPSQNPTGSQNTTNATTGVTTGVFPPGSPQNQGSPAKPTLTPATLPNGQAGFTDSTGNFVDASGNPISASTINNQAPDTTPPNSYQGLLGQGASAASGNAAVGQSAANIAADYGKKIAAVGQQGANAQAGYETTGTTPVAEGNSGVIARNVAAQQTALATGESAALAGTGQQLTAQQQETAGLTNLANLAPELLRYGGSANMTAAEATAYKANLASAGDLATKINTLSSTKDAADAGFTRLVNAAGALGGDTPIAQGLATLAGTTIQGSPQATAFLSQLASARQQWTDLGLGDATTALPDTITKTQLLQAQQTMEKQVQANLTNYQSQLDKIKTNPTGDTGTSNTNTGGATVVETNPDGTPKAMSF